MTDANNLTDDELTRKFYSNEPMTAEVAMVAFNRLGLTKNIGDEYSPKEDMVKQRETAVIAASNLPNKNVSQLLENADIVFEWIKSNRFHTK